MQNKDWMETGEEILRSVLKAVENQDYTDLSKKVEQKVNGAIDYINIKKKDTDKKPNATEEWLRTKQLQPPQLYKKNPPGTYSGIVCRVLGIVGCSLTGLACAILTILAWATNSFGIVLADLIVGVFWGGSIALTVYGSKKSEAAERFKTYVRLVGEKQYCEIAKLAQTVGKKAGFVKKELRKMINKGYFLQGHLDNGETTLITSDFMYQKYLEAEKSRQNRALEEKKRMEVREENRTYPEQIRKILEEGEGYIQYIRKANDAIPGEVMSQKLARLEDIMKRIFEQLKKHPESSDDLQKLMKYYLPTTTKLLDAYIDLDGQPSYGGNNISNTKKEIEDTLDIINDAFSKLFDDMFEDAAWDISTEISTMKTILAKEGLTGGNDFH